MEDKTDILLDKAINLRQIYILSEEYKNLDIISLKSKEINLRKLEIAKEIIRLRDHF